MDTHNYQKNIEDIIVSLDSNLEQGLTDDQVLKRRETYGFNQLDETKKRSWFLRFFDQINDFMIYVLIAASILSFVTDEISEGFLILAIVLINAALGLFQEAKAEKALESIKAMSSPHAKVLTNGTQILVDVKEITVGDIVILDAGDYVPADVRIIESINLKTDESPLTGESVPVEKDVEASCEQKAPLGDRINMVFAGCAVVNFYFRFF